MKKNMPETDSRMKVFELRVFRSISVVVLHGFLLIVILFAQWAKVVI